MDLEVRLFAGLREALGKGSIRVRLADGACVADLVTQLAKDNAALAPHVGRFAVAVNLAVAPREQALHAGDEVALLPPVGGGSTDGSTDEARDLIELTRSTIDVSRLVAFATHPGAGGISLFLGTARDLHEGKAVLHLEYEAYEDMALASFKELARATRAHVPAVKKLALVHRLGHVPIGEASVAVVASCPHRAESFQACRFAIDELKKLAPIWKKERLSDGGERWIENR